jgi:hypothetical protein
VRLNANTDYAAPSGKATKNNYELRQERRTLAINQT